MFSTDKQLDPDFHWTYGIETRKTDPSLFKEPNIEKFIKSLNSFNDLGKLKTTLSQHLSGFVKEVTTGARHLNSFEKVRPVFKEWLDQTRFICISENERWPNIIYRQVEEWCNNFENNILILFEGSILSTDLGLNRINDTPLLKIWQDLRSQTPVSPRMEPFSPNKNTPPDKPTYSPYPEFDQHIQDELYLILCKRFVDDDRTELERIIKKGGNVTQNLRFRARGHLLTDAFNRLFKENLLIIGSKKDLAIWMSNNFSYQVKKEFKPFSFRTVHDFLSDSDRVSENPILWIKKDPKSKEKKILSR